MSSESNSKANRGLKMCLIVSGLLVVILAIVIVVMFLTIFKIKDPITTVTPVGLDKFQISPNLNKNMSLAMIITMGNPNRGSFKFEDSTGYVIYNGNTVGEIPVGGNFVPALGEINVTTAADLNVRKLTQDRKFWQDIKIGILNLTSTNELDGKVSLFTISKKASVDTNCDMQFDVLRKHMDSKCISKIKV